MIRLLGVNAINENGKQMTTEYDDSSVLTATLSLAVHSLKFGYGSFGEVYLMIRHSQGTACVYKLSRYSSEYTISLNKYHNSSWLGWKSITFA